MQAWRHGIASHITGVDHLRHIGTTLRHSGVADFVARHCTQRCGRGLWYGSAARLYGATLYYGVAALRCGTVLRHGVAARLSTFFSEIARWLFDFLTFVWKKKCWRLDVIVRFLILIDTTTRSLKNGKKVHSSYFSTSRHNFLSLILIS